jgi:hypothetical protein
VPWSQSQAVLRTGAYRDLRRPPSDFRTVDDFVGVEARSEVRDKIREASEIH